MYELNKQEKYRDLVFRINDRVAQWYDMNRRYQVYPDYDGILGPKPGFMGNNSITAASLDKQGKLNIETVVPEGKKAMAFSAWLNS